MNILKIIQFLAHKEHLQKMFEHPMNWCILNLDSSYLIEIKSVLTL